MTALRTLAFLGLTTLAACATPLEQCIRSANQNVRAINAGIATAEGNISRGYAIHENTEQYISYGTCYDSDNNRYICPETAYRTVETPVPIDVSEQRKRRNELRKLLPEAEERARRAVQQCYQIHPEG